MKLIARLLTAAFIAGICAADGFCAKKTFPARETAASTQTVAAPAFSLRTYNDKEIILDSYAGKPVLLVFISAKCPICKTIAPALETLHKTYKPKGLEVIGIALEEKKYPVEEFVKAEKITFPVCFKGAETAKLYAIRGVPFVYLLDKKHKIVKIWPGYQKSFAQESVKEIAKALR